MALLPPKGCIETQDGYVVAVMVAFLQGVALFFSTPQLWGYAWKPMLWAALVYLGLLITGIVFVIPALVNSTDLPGWLSVIVNIAGGVLFAVLWLYLSNVIFLVIAGLFSSFLWDHLSEQVEIALYGDAPR